MRGVFEDAAPEPEQPRRDTELTLSSMTLLAIFFGLVLVCGLCFGMGYTLGHRVPQQPGKTAPPSADTEATLQEGILRPKPSATEPIGAAPSPQSVVVDLPPSAAADSSPAANAPSLQPALPQVQPALQTVASTAPSGQPAVAASVAPALAPAAPLMVQIAAVAHDEDAEVLVSALRSRGYVVVARHDPADGLIHVRLGPFSTRDAANRWRLKLIGDGYNAVVQP